MALTNEELQLEVSELKERNALVAERKALKRERFVLRHPHLIKSFADARSDLQSGFAAVVSLVKDLNSNEHVERRNNKMEQTNDTEYIETPEHESNQNFLMSAEMMPKDLVI